MFQENKKRQIFRKTNTFYHLIRTSTCAYQVVKNVRFSENLTGFIFLKHLFWDSPFCLTTDEFTFVQILYVLFLFWCYHSLATEKKVQKVWTFFQSHKSDSCIWFYVLIDCRLAQRSYRSYITTARLQLSE